MKIRNFIAIASMAIGSLCASAAEIPSDITALYLIGEASPTGWDLGAAPEFTNGGEGLFSWKGHLGTGQFKMAVSRSNWNSLVSADQDNYGVQLGTPMKMAYNPESGDQDWKWYNNVEGEYTLTVNLADATLTVIATEPEEITALYLVGEAVATGWDRDNAPELTAQEGGVFTWSGDLAAGGFKFLTSRASWTALVAAEPDMAVVLGEAMSASVNPEGGDHDYKWAIAEAGKYNLVVNIKDMTLTVTKQEEVDGIAAVGVDSEAEFYTLTGIKVNNPNAGIYVKVVGGKATKVTL